MTGLQSRTLFSVVAVLVGAAGCTTVPGACRSNSFTDEQCRHPDTDELDTGPFLELEPSIALLEIDHDAEAWTYAVELQGWSGLVTVEIRQVLGLDQWEETHPLDDVDYAKDGTWDRWYKRLFVESDWAAQIDGVSTRFPPTDAQQALLTWMVSAWDRSLTAVQDCVVLGADTSLFTGYGCREWTGE